MQRPRFNSWDSKIHWRRDRLPNPVFLGFPCGSAGKGSACSMGDLGLIPVLGRSPGEGKGYPLQYSRVENSMNCIVHGVTKSWTQLSDFDVSLSELREMVMDREAWHAVLHGVVKSWTRLSYFHLHIASQAPSPDLPSWKIHFNKISKWLSCTSRLETLC